MRPIKLKFQDILDLPFLNNMKIRVSIDHFLKPPAVRSLEAGEKGAVTRRELQLACFAGSLPRRQVHVSLRERNSNTLGVKALLDRLIERPKRFPEFVGLDVGSYQKVNRGVTELLHPDNGLRCGQEAFV